MVWADLQAIFYHFLNLIKFYYKNSKSIIMVSYSIFYNSNSNINSLLCKYQQINDYDYNNNSLYIDIKNIDNKNNSH